MNSIVWTYPGFESLPKGIKQMLVASEAHFIKEAKPRSAHAVLDRTMTGESWTPRLIQTFGGQFAGTCGAWGKQNQVIRTLTM